MFEQPHVPLRPRWAQRMTEQSEKPRPLPHILSGIELQMDLELDNMAKEGFKPEEDTIPEGPFKPSPFDAGAHLSQLSLLLYRNTCVHAC